ncbi:cysteine proteinase [Microthyrium microscopicum]|uniref:ubiquitinyl hydrolase 1 n=1 Tax=Microthyrium microscopicum TaxID=703497 RepID=A0A6A6TUW9_9PEZI|nr:cysteine proteinase [Microthyrium microscopicum]
MNHLSSEMNVDQFQAEGDVHVITTPEDSVIDESEKREEDVTPSLAADDFEAIKAAYMPPLTDLETLDEAHHTWDIEGWRTMPRREHGPTFTCAGFPWRVLFFPFGNNVEYASFYLEHGFEDNKPPEDWYACAQFLLVLWNPKDPRIFQQHTATHRFTSEEGDWGFTRFAEIRRLFDNKWESFDRSLVEDNSAKLTAFVRVVKDPTGVLWHTFNNYDSKKETGMVGLKNQGATCYLNSLLQSLYFTTAFRKAVYQIPTDLDENARESSAYALQRLFLQLQTAESAVPTNELTASFGWSSREIFEQQDVQELSRVLMEKLEEKMKGSEADHALARMFVGKTKTYISCINVDYQSTKIEEYWDVQLNVAQMTGLDMSFAKYIEPELMDGENKYQAEGHGLQDAKKGSIFESFPSVLHLQLKRFDYDWQRDVMMKINDRFEFPETWDASPYLSEDADRSEPYIYKLHGVLVHSGDLHAGHYYAFLKPEKDGHFYKFDDDRVTRATLKEAIDDNFGGEYPTVNGAPPRNSTAKPLKRVNSAYMLVYIRECHLDRILLADEVVQPPAAVATRFAEEKLQIEKRKKEKEEAHLYMDITVCTETNFQHHQGFDLIPTASIELTDDAANPSVIRVKKKTSMSEFIEIFASQANLDHTVLRPWCMVNRQNGTTRPDTPLTDLEMTVEEATSKFGHKNALRLWMENAVSKDKDGKPLFGDATIDIVGRGGKEGDKPIVLFLKFFDVDKQTLYGIGHFYAITAERVQDLSSEILRLMNWPAGTAYKIFEEIKHNMIEPMKPKLTLHQAELQDGDILTVQRVISESEMPVIQRKFTEVREFYDYLLNRTTVRFAPKNNDGEDFVLALNKKLMYDDFSRAVGEHLNMDPRYLRFSTVNHQTGRPKQTIRHTINYNLGQILNPSTYSAYGASVRSDALYYEKLECTMAELEQRRSMKVTWLPEGQSKEELYELLVKKQGSVADLIDLLALKAGISEELKPRIRLFEVHGYRHQKDLPPAGAVINLNDYATIYADLRGEDELQLDDKEFVAQAFSFEKEPNKAHGFPFSFVVREGELLSATKERLSKRMNVKGKAFEKIKFAVVPKTGYGKPEPLTDEDVLSDKLTANDFLGLDYPAKSRGYLGKVDQIQIR